MSLTLLVVTAHPADAFDLAAGTIARHSEAGDRVEVASVTHGARSHAPSIYDDKQEELDAESENRLLDQIKAEKKAEFEAAAAAVGVDRTHFLGMDDEPFVATREAILRLAELYRQVRPDILITHHRTEMNHHDHPARRRCISAGCCDGCAVARGVSSQSVSDPHDLLLRSSGSARYDSFQGNDRTTGYPCR